MLLHSSLHIFHRVNVDLPSKHPVKTVERQSASSLPHTRYGIDPAFVHTALVPGTEPGNVTRSQPGINPGTCLRSHRRHTIFRDQRAV